MRELLKILNKKEKSLLVQECRDKNRVKFDAYYNTIILSIGLKHIFTNDEPCKFKINRLDSQSAI